MLGFAHAGELELEPVAHVLEAAPRINVTWHRAFDQLRDPLGAIETLAGVAPIDRILTSGGEGTIAMRCERLRACQERAGARLTIIAGGGVDFEMLSALVEMGSIREAHVGRAAHEDQDPNGVVSAAAVGRLREIIDEARVAEPRDAAGVISYGVGLARRTGSRQEVRCLNEMVISRASRSTGSAQSYGGQRFARWSRREALEPPMVLRRPPSAPPTLS